MDRHFMELSADDRMETLVRISEPQVTDLEQKMPISLLERSLRWKVLTFPNATKRWTIEFVPLFSENQ